MSLSTLILASNNEGKQREFAALLAPLNIQIILQRDKQVPEIDEPYATFLENALHKARHASRCTGLPALADDSGLCVAALGGAPGIHSARFAGEPRSDGRNNALLIEQLQGIANRRACYHCSLVLVRSPEDPLPIVSEGTLYGEIHDVPCGQNGFGYDPYFYLPELGQTAAEIPAELKNRISHRGIALQQLVSRLQPLINGSRSA